MSTERHFYRCCDCLTVFALDGPQLRYDIVCDLCDGAIEHMGRVESSSLVKDELRCNCDDRCTSARGPKCDCKCGGINHGAGLIAYTRIVVNVADELPRLTRPDATAKRKAEQYRAAIAAARDIINELAERKRATRWLDSADYTRMYRAQVAVRKAAKARCHRARLRILAEYVSAAVVQIALFA